MGNQSECIKVKDRAGKVLLSIYPGAEVVVDRGLSGNGHHEQATKGGNGKNNGNGNGNGESMTFPQKKFLFRLLAGQGIEGDKAQERLKDLFKVEHLKEVGKMEASRMIERLLKESKGGD